MNTKTILAISLAAIFVVSMMPTANIWATHGFSIDSTDKFRMTVHGAPGQTTDGHAIVVYAFFTNEPGSTPDSFVAYVAAVHPTFVDDNEQNHIVNAIHGHALELNNDTYCVQALAKNPTATVNGNVVKVNGGHGEITAYVIAGYDVVDSSICPTQVYDLEPVT